MGKLRHLIPCLAVLATLLALPVVARADTITLGSDLTGVADVIEHHGADSAFWNVKLQSGGMTTAPVGGQVTVVKVKGNVLEDPTGRQNPIPMIHFQTLHPMGDGSVKVELSSAPFYVPLGGDPNTITTYKPINMCLHKGDYLDFNDIGGNEWHWGPFDGMPFQTFSRVPGSSVNFYSKNQGTNIGSRWSPQETKQGEELLMQMKFATGPDATDICPGGYAQHVFEGTDLRGGQIATLRTKARTAKIRLTCPNPTYGACQGVLRADTVLNGQPVTLGSGTFDTQHAYSDSVEIPLSSAAIRAIQRARGVQVRLTANSHDDPRHDGRVYSSRTLNRTSDDVVPVQHKTTTATITLKPDKLIVKKKKSSKKKKKKRKKNRRSSARR